MAIYALSETVRASQLYAWRCEEAGIPVSWPLAVQVDNTQTRAFHQGTTLQSRLRGVVDLRWGWVSELRDKAKIEVRWVPGEANKADILTKCFPNWLFQRRLRLVRDH